MIKDSLTNILEVLAQTYEDRVVDSFASAGILIKDQQSQPLFAEMFDIFGEAYNGLSEAYSISSKLINMSRDGIKEAWPSDVIDSGIVIEEVQRTEQINHASIQLLQELEHAYTALADAFASSAIIIEDLETETEQTEDTLFEDTDEINEINEELINVSHELADAYAEAADAFASAAVLIEDQKQPSVTQKSLSEVDEASAKTASDNTDNCVGKNTIDAEKQVKYYKCLEL